MKPLLPPEDLRARFARALSRMYRDEVPRYGQLADLMRDLNRKTLEADPVLRERLEANGELDHLDDERHGAIRVGLPSELSTLRRVFAVLGMQPVSYYDLSEAGIPVHSTAFRPTDPEELKTSPFRIFTSLLRLELIEDETLRRQARKRLEQRQIFTPHLLQLLEQAEQAGGLDESSAETFVEEALRTFRWHREATVSHDQYQRFLSAHRLVADIVCFRGPHINHLTPRSLDIDRVQQAMTEAGFDAKKIVEGPPLRKHPILLRQTSFNALEEGVRFSDGVDGHHRARFGEIEQRGMALTRRGRALYDELLAEVRSDAPSPQQDPRGYEQNLQRVFSRFPDDIDELRQQGLAWFRYLPGPKAAGDPGSRLDDLLEQGLLRVEPVTYEDFLPVSAAGIFRSNLGEGETRNFAGSPNQADFEAALGAKVLDEFEWYATLQRDSLEQSLKQLGCTAERRAELLRQLPAAT